jgi:hypothetical protein
MTNTSPTTLPPGSAPTGPGWWHASDKNWYSKQTNAGRGPGVNGRRQPEVKKPFCRPTGVMVAAVVVAAAIVAGVTGCGGTKGSAVGVSVPAATAASAAPTTVAPAMAAPSLAPGATSLAVRPAGEKIRVSKCFINSDGEMLIKASSSTSNARLFAYRPDGTRIGEVQNGGGSKYGGTVMPWQSHDPVMVTIVSSAGGSMTVPTTPFGV